MNASNKESGDSKRPPDTDIANSHTEQKTSKDNMTPNAAAAELSTPMDIWWDGQLKALYQSVIDEPLPEDMLKLVRSPKLQTGNVPAKEPPKQEDE